MAKAKAALAPLSNKLAEDERAKHTRKTAQDEWNTQQPTASDDVLAAIAKEENVDQGAPELLARIWSTARELYRRQKEVARLTAKLEEEGLEIKRLSESVLPEMMDEAQTKEMTSESGFKLVKANKVYGNISEENKAAAHTWLETNKYGSIIKFGFMIAVEKGDVKLAKSVRALLRKAKLAFEERSAVHYQTLQAFIRESVETARALPPSITYHVQPTVEIKVPKVKKTKTTASDSTSNDIDL